jgi:hypothetical protein
MSRRFAVYFSWSRPEEYATPQGVEQSTPLGVLENRYPTLFEFRRAVWPAFEQFRDPANFNQSIAGFFDNIVLPDFRAFTSLIKEETGNEVKVIQRKTDDATLTPLDDDLLNELDTLIVVSLDHLRTEQQATASELEAIKAFLSRQGTCVVICPHHDIGAEDNLESRIVEFKHHQDVSIPAQQRLAGFAQSLLAGLGVPVVNRFGLNPAKSIDGTPAPLLVNRDLPGVDTLLSGVTTFNLHPHLPHFEASTAVLDKIDVLASQLINPDAPPHPFSANNRYFNALLRIRPPGLVGTVLVCDATIWSSAFGGLESLQVFWKNLAKLPT